MKRTLFTILAVLALGSAAASAQENLEVRRVGLDSLVHFLRKEFNPEIYFIMDEKEQSSFTVSAPRGQFLESAFGQMREKGYVISSYGNAFFILNSKTVFTVGFTHDGPLVLEFDPETGRLVSSGDYDSQSGDEVNIADYKPVVSGSLCKIDTLGNITTMDLVEQEVKTVIDNNWYSPYFSDLAEDVKLIDCDENGAVIYSQKTTTYSLLLSGVSGCVTILKKADTNPHAGKKIIEIAPPIDKEMTEYLSNAIYEFNRTDDEYLIRVWSKYKTGIKAGRDLSILNADDEKLYTMIQELNGSESPDIAIGIQKNYAMRDDVFEDLTGSLDEDVLAKQFTNIIDASKIGDTLYFLPVTLEIEGLVTDTNYRARYRDTRQ